MENATSADKISCHDCGKEIERSGEDLVNGFSLIYKENERDNKLNVYKCTECFKTNPSLSLYKDCEVYSRVVGYIRPVSQWNKGKKQEYCNREEFKITN